MPNKKNTVFDLNEMQVFPFAEREKNIFFCGAGFKTRIIVLPAGGTMPECQMHTAVIFYVVSGEVEVTVDGEVKYLGAGHCLIGEPGRYSMRTAAGARLLGIQIQAGQASEKA
ncbi:MAG: cupin domain-containing protein [Candidatus Aminicenantes bacterium]|nr:cupin domain-containing protein [Candidatus Aminicenantes bacterium]